MNWWRRLLHRNHMEEQLEKEMRFHLDQHAADLIARGIDANEARRQARLAIGGPQQVKENCRDARGTRWLEDLLQDVRYAFRTVRQNPGFAGVALLTLALGIGATTVMFTVINGVLLKPLSFPQPDRLVTLHEQTAFSTEYGNQWAFSYPNFQDCERESRSLAMAAYRFMSGTISSPGVAEYVSGRQISASLFSVLGVSPTQGRTFLADEDKPGTAAAIVLSYSLWQRRFNRSPSALGTPLVFDGKPYTIVGVAPAGFRLDGEEPDVFTSLGQSDDPILENRGGHRLRVAARLRPGVTLSQAQAEVTLLADRLAGQFPKTNASRTFIAEQFRPDVGNVRSTLWLLLGAVFLVLLIACANVASLLLARAVSRERELAMRVALGAGRFRLMRQCLTESAVLGLCGGMLGLLLGAVGIRPFVALWPGSLPRSEEIQLDWRVLLFALAASLLSGLLFGLAPALRAPARDLEQALRAGARTLSGGSRSLHGGFVVSEIAIAVVLLVSAGILGRTLMRLSSLDPGMNFRNILITRTALSPVVLQSPDRIRAAWQDILERARSVAGVESVATVDTVPMRDGFNELGYSASSSLPPANEQPLALATSVTPDYLAVMGIPLREGRFFSDHDRMGSEPVIVIDDVLAHSAFGREQAVGKRLWIPNMGPGPFLVVGVVGHVRHWGLASDDQAQVRAQFYYPFAQVPDTLLRRWSELTSLAVRTNIAPLSVVEPLRGQLRGASNDQVLYEVRTMEELVSASLARQRFLLLLFAIFAALALLLASIGVYGVLAYLTTQRVPEIGIRIALGANAQEVMWLVLRQSLGMIAIGIAVGVTAAFAAARLLKGSVDGVQSTGPGTFVFMISVLIAAAFCASFVPARRASRLDPMRALRQE